MILNDILDGVKKFIETEVASVMKFQKEKTDPIEYVNPNVFKIAVPHKNFTPLNFQVPFISIGLMSGSDGDEDHKITIRITCAVYGGTVDEEIGIPNNDGYEDLLNLIDRIKTKLIEKSVIEGIGTIDGSINYGIYNEELIYPYHYGYIEFDIRTVVNESVVLNDIL